MEENGAWNHKYLHSWNVILEETIIKVAQKAAYSGTEDKDFTI